MHELRTPASCLYVGNIASRWWGGGWGTHPHCIYYASKIHLTASYLRILPSYSHFLPMPCYACEWWPDLLTWECSGLCPAPFSCQLRSCLCSWLRRQLRSHYHDHLPFLVTVSVCLKRAEHQLQVHTAVWELDRELSSEVVGWLLVNNQMHQAWRRLVLLQWAAISVRT